MVLTTRIICMPCWNNSGNLKQLASLTTRVRDLKLMSSFSLTLPLLQAAIKSAYLGRKAIQVLPIVVLSPNRMRSLHCQLLKDPELLKEYDHIIKDQMSKSIVEKIPESNDMDANLVHYLPHHAVLCRERLTTKLWIVYNGLAKSNNWESSLNDCLQTRTNFIPKLFDMLIKFRSYSFALTVDIEKAFLMVAINNPDCNVVHFLWLEDPSKLDSSVLHLQFTRIVFGFPCYFGSCHFTPPTSAQKWTPQASWATWEVFVCGRPHHKN